MAVANTKSAAIQANESIPVTQVASFLSANGAPLNVAVATVEVAAADDNASVYRMLQVPSNAIITRLEILNDAIAGATDYDVGLYKQARYGGAAVDVDLLCDGLDMTVERYLPLDATFQIRGIETAEQRLWQLLGLTADPQVVYELCFTANTVGTAAGTLSIRVQWAQ